jgi:hypothetical protein
MIQDEKICISEYYQSKLIGKILPKDTWSCTNLFIGEIKNINELKQILKMMGVK